MPGLWMGGHEFTGRSGGLELAVVRDEFDLVLTLLRLPGHGAGRGGRAPLCGRYRTVRSTGPDRAA